VLSFATLSDVQQATSGEVILMTLLGGTGTFFGPVAGAAVVVTLQEYLSRSSAVGLRSSSARSSSPACSRSAVASSARFAALRRGGH